MQNEKTNTLWLVFGLLALVVATTAPTLGYSVTFTPGQGLKICTPTPQKTPEATETQVSTSTVVIVTSTAGDASKNPRQTPRATLACPRPEVDTPS